MNKIYQKKLQEYQNFKNEVFSILGKKTKLNRFDFEKYIKIKFDAVFYDSLQEYYRKKNINVKVDNIKDFVDILAFHIVERNYRVTMVDKDTFKPTFIYYSYNNDELTDIYIHNSGIKGSSFWGIFISNGDKIIEQNLKRYCS